MRPDIADIRLADRVFAPHYAAPVTRRLTRDAALRADRLTGSETLGRMTAGDSFELLDVTGGAAWGIAVSLGLVGYLDAHLLDPA